MKTMKMLGLSIAAIATVGATASYAAPARHHAKPHKVCKVVKQHHHAKRVCRWVR